ncbi:fatty acid desaturase-domain-containing protein [Stachybotrys elegans]|uniref:Fatty acid desaturase-domain-containing protein n=1 Tax=Stachybotrys elegans TaxID=80388 RepID=A0A8K0WTE4_9HYPO|nr:fatty acid desaturase-domain-containing protein [Stachybotrys elegans]
MLQTTEVEQSVKTFELGWLKSDAQKPLARSENEQFRQAFKLANDFRLRESEKSLLAIASNYIVIGSCVLLSEKAWSAQCSDTIKAAIYGIACLFISSRMRAFENLVHEASHFNLFKTPSMHYHLQFLYAFPIFRVLEDYRRSHIIHHQYLGDPAKDPDLVRIFELGLDNVSDKPFYYLFALPFSGYIHWEYLSTTFADFWSSRSAYPSKAVFWATAITSIYLVPGLPRLASLYYVVPFFLILPIIRYWAEASEHLGMDMTGKFGNSRSNLGFVHTWFMHPHNDGYHAVHHLHAQVPFHQLPKAHEALMAENEAFRAKTIISTGFAETFQQIASKRISVKSISKAFQ